LVMRIRKPPFPPRPHGRRKDERCQRNAEKNRGDNRSYEGRSTINVNNQICRPKARTAKPTYKKRRKRGSKDGAKCSGQRDHRIRKGERKNLSEAGPKEGGGQIKINFKVK